MNMKRKTFLSIIVLTILFVICLMTNTYAVEGEDGQENDVVWTDFSNATISLEKEGVRGVNLQITNVEANSEHWYFYSIAEEKPTFDPDNTENFDILSYNDNKFLVYGVESAVELNQKLNLWVVERVYTNGEWEYSYVIEGEELTRPEYPKYSNIFTSSFISKDETQIIFNVPWGGETRRTINLKIGKITDNSILNKIKNNDATGFEELMNYSKTQTAIYDEQLTSSKNGNYYTNGYETSNGDTPINLTLEDDVYYYVYAELDDENGKYYPVEGITIARANVFSEQDTWSLHLLGEEDFEWSDFGEPNQPQGPQEDPTIADNDRLPNTGVTITILALIVVISIISIIYYRRYKLYKDVK